MSQEENSETPPENTYSNTFSNMSIPEVNEPINLEPDSPILPSLSARLSRYQNQIRRGSNAVKMLSEDYNITDTDLPSRRASSPEKRSLRNSVIKLLAEQEFARRFSAPEKTRSRRSSSIVKTVSEEHEHENEGPDADMGSRRSSRSSRSGSIVKMTSEDNFADDECSRRSSRADFTDFDRRRSSVRRGSSIVRMLSEEVDEKPTRLEPENRPENYRKSVDNGYKHSLESISEHKPNSNPLIPNLESPTLDCLSDFAKSLSELSLDGDQQNSQYISLLQAVNHQIQNVSSPRSDSDNRSGEWNFFWKNYSGSTGQNKSNNQYLCPSNSVELLSDSDTTQIDRGQERIYFTVDEIQEALHCAQRVLDILKDGLKRNEEDIETTPLKEEPMPSSRASSIPKIESKIPKASGSSCIETFLNNTGVADILKKVLNKRREVIMPPDDSRRSSYSGWTSSDSQKK